MPRARMYSIEEVLNLTVKDIQGPNFMDVKVKGWHKLTSEQRERCILKLRDLKRQRDELAQSTTVEAGELEDRLKRVHRSRSPTPVLPPFDPDDPENIAIEQKVEREAYEELIGDNGRPCYPIELGLKVFHNPGQYKDIFSYWQGAPGIVDKTNRFIFSPQLQRWKRFREFQQRNRRYFISHSRFPEFQQKVLERRQRHGLDGDVQLLEKQDKQSQLDDWMEYQDYELREYDERLEKDLEETQERLASRRKTLADAGISAFGEIQELDFASYYSLAMEWDSKEAKAENKEKVAERELRLAEKRLKAAESDDLGERVERATWVRMFQREVESAQVRLDELQPLYEDAERELAPCWWWVQAKLNEFAKRREEDIEEVEIAEFEDKIKERNELLRKRNEARRPRDEAKEEVEFAEEELKAAQLDDIEETIGRADLIKAIRGDVRSAQTQLEEAKESTEKIILKRRIIGGLSSISVIKGKMKRHNVLLEWIEQQRREIVGGRADTEKEGRSKRVSLRVLRNRPATEASKPAKPPKASGRKRKQPTARSILGPVDPAKVSKAPSKRRIPHQKMSVLCDVSQAAEKTTTDSSTPESRSKQVLKVKDSIPASLRPTHSSRVSKPGGKRPSGPHREVKKLPPTTGTHRLIREENLGSLLASSMGRNAMQQSANAPLRRSTRISKQPERFRPAIHENQL